MSQAECVGQILVFLEHPRSARLALLAGQALFELGEAELAVAVWTLGDDANGMVRRIKDNPQAPAEGRNRSRLADAELCRFLTGLHGAAVDAFELQTGSKQDRVRNAVWPLTHVGEVNYRVPMQRPVIFYMPDLPATAVEPNDAFPWAPSLKASTAAIRGEYEAGMRAAVDVQPYVAAGTIAQDWALLRGSLDWSAIHLYKQARETPMLANFPKTTHALGAVDLARIDGAPMEVFFSRLKPGAHIPPHHGLTNSRVTVHLPLIVPNDCEIRVGRELTQWREGEVFAFDDSFEHEAWNRSGDDRVVLIFESHHPDLTLLERSAVEHVFTARQRWLDSRMGMVRRWLELAGADLPPQ
jgi:aspartate beta-hydroxylase